MSLSFSYLLTSERFVGVSAEAGDFEPGFRSGDLIPVFFSSSLLSGTSSVQRTFLPCSVEQLRVEQRPTNLIKGYN